MDTQLAIPTRRELETFSPKDRWNLEDSLEDAQDILQEFNDEELQQWVEVEHKTQAEIAKIVGRSQQRVSQRCMRLGIAAGSTRGRKRITTPSNSPDLEAEVVEGEVVDTSPARRRRNGEPALAAHHLPDVVSPEAGENLRTQVLHWFEQGQHLRELLNKKRPLESRSAEDRKAIKREATAMERVARRIKETCE